MARLLSFRHLRMLPGSAVALACLVALSLGGHAVHAAQPTGLVPSIGVLPFAGDVYTVSANGTLIPVLPASTPASAQLFNLAGSPLNLTWGAWAAATGTAYAYQSPDPHHPATFVGLVLQGLIPHGVYSVFYRTFSPDTNNPLCPTVEPSLALHSINPFQQPDHASFVADAAGNGFFLGVVPGELLAAQQVQYSVIYHFDGKTYGELANAAEAASQPVAPGGVCRSSYGIDAMRQFLIIQK